MVNTMLKTVRLSTLLLLLMVQALSYSKAEEDAFNLPLFKSFQDTVYVSIQPKTITLGERITLTIRGESLQEDFEKIDWSSWQSHLKIEEIDIGFNRIKVRLYPFTHGQFHFTEQQVGRIKLPKFSLTVQSNPQVAIQWSRPPSNLYPQQNTAWKARVWLQNPANKATMKPPTSMLETPTPYQVRVSPLAMDTVASSNSSPLSKQNNNGKTETLIARYTMPTTIPQDTPTIQLPSLAVVIKNPSNQKWYFFDRPLTAQIKPLPHFLPATVTVGQLQVTPSPLTYLQEQGKLNYWVWQLSSQNLSATQLKQLGRQLIEQIPYDPAIEWLSSSQKITTQWTTSGLQNQITLRLPYRITQFGWTHFPALNLPFFNPESGKLESFFLPAQPRLTLPSAIIWFGKGVVMLLSVMALFLVGNWLKIRLKNFWLKQQLIQKIQHTHHAKELWYALQQWSQTHSNHKIQTLGEWQTWCQQTQSCNPPATLIEQLNQQLYAQQTTEDNHKKQWKKLQKMTLTWVKQNV